MIPSYYIVALSALAVVVRGAPYVQSENDIMSRPSQAVAVSGQLLCNGEPMPNVLIKLYDHDSKFRARRITVTQNETYLSGCPWKSGGGAVLLEP